MHSHARTTNPSPSKSASPRERNNPNSSNLAGLRAKVTWEHIERAIVDGHGSGRGEDYRPWLRIRRTFSSPSSNQLIVPTPVHRRAIHLLSRSEYHAALAAVWLGAKEIREQAPIAPFAQPHPNSPGSGPNVPGTTDIADSMGIRHSRFFGTNLPYIHTIDLLLNFADLNCNTGEKGLVFWSCKPAALLKPKARGLKRRTDTLRIEQAYAEHCSGHYAVVDGTQYSKELIANLQWITPLFSEWDEHKNSNIFKDFSACCGEKLQQTEIRHAVAQAGQQLKIKDMKYSWSLFRMAAWKGHIDIDLSKPILHTRMANTGGQHIKRSLSKQLTGAADWD